MAFDRTDPTDLQALKTEVNDDPNLQGYSSVLGSTGELLKLLNDPTLNNGSPTINRPTEELDIPEIAAVIDEAEYAALTEYDKVWVQMFINQAADVMLKPFQSKFMEVFPVASNTTTAALALRAKPASRAEIVFGVNTVISREDWLAARDS